MRISSIALAFGSILALATPSAAETFRFQSFLGQDAPGTQALLTMAEDLRAETGGEIDIQLSPASAFVPWTKSIDAIRNGLIDGHFSAPTYFARIDPAFALLGDTIAAYPNQATRDRWFQEGGGMELARETYAAHGLRFVCPIYYPSEHIPSTVPIDGVEDFKGLKMRSPGGLARDLMHRVGVTSIEADLKRSFSAMKAGVLNATDLANVALNLRFGVYEFAKYSVDAGHSMPVTDVVVSQAKWDAISAEAQEQFQAACHRMSDRVRDALTAMDQEARATAEGDLGVTFIAFDAEQRATFQALSFEVWKDWAEKTPMTRRIVESHLAFLNAA